MLCEITGGTVSTTVLAQGTYRTGHGITMSMSLVQVIKLHGPYTLDADVMQRNTIGSLALSNHIGSVVKARDCEKGKETDDPFVGHVR